MGGRHKSDPTGNGRAAYIVITLVAIALIVVAALAVISVM
jgi:hypothetical protein